MTRSPHGMTDDIVRDCALGDGRIVHAWLYDEWLAAVRSEARAQGQKEGRVNGAPRP